MGFFSTFHAYVIWTGSTAAWFFLLLQQAGPDRPGTPAPLLAKNTSSLRRFASRICTKSPLAFFAPEANRSKTMSSFKGAPDNVALLLFFVFWYAGNMKYNEYNTSSLNAVGGKTAGMTMIVATMQLGACAVYALVMWAVKINPAKMFGGQPPAKQDMPKTTQADLVKTVPVGFCSAAAHACTVFALGGDPLFGQIVKSGEPVHQTPPTSRAAFCVGAPSADFTWNRTASFSLPFQPFSRRSLIADNRRRNTPREG